MNQWDFGVGVANQCKATETLNFEFEFNLNCVWETGQSSWPVGVSFLEDAEVYTLTYFETSSMV